MTSLASDGEETLDPTAQIRKFASLRDDAILTDEEFEAKKRELLGL